MNARVSENYLAISRSGFAGKPIMLLKRPCAALTWIQSYLNDRTQRVAVGSVVSNSMHLQCGVPQSYVLGTKMQQS